MDRYPKKGDTVIDWDRQDRGQEYYGTIRSVDKQDESVRVRFEGGEIEQLGSIVRIDNILYPSIILVTNTEMKNGGGDIIYYSFDELDGNWSSHELVYEQDGDGAWLIGGDNAELGSG